MHTPLSRVAFVSSALALLLAAPGAFATPVAYEADRAVGDAFIATPGSDGHAIFAPGMGNDYAPGDLTYEEDLMAGQARLFGTVIDTTQPGDQFIVDIVFSGFVPGSAPPPGSPSKGLLPSAYIENGGPIDPGTWHYWTDTTGTLTGAGGNAGAIVEVNRAGPAFQVGVGANEKNVLFGAAGWIALTVLSHPDRGPFAADDGIGDINIQLPEPGTPVLMALGLAGFGMTRSERRRR